VNLDVYGYNKTINNLKISL